MAEACIALYRLDFCADLAAAQAPVFNLGYMLEAAIDDGSRYLGLTSRFSLTLCERDHANLETWPELSELDSYMEKLFNQVWSFAEEADRDDLSLGVHRLAREYTAMSALTFGQLDVPAETLIGLRANEEDYRNKAFSDAVFGYGKLLKPTITAPVLEFVPVVRRPTAPRPKYRLEAA